ncbi:MAG: signal peptide peptidase SppA [Bacteroidetes bacterium]|nr:signal peptide peptidase SppA [Bacteroidota bacterium]
MKDFFKFMFASMLGFFLTIVILFFLFMAFIMAALSFTQPEEVVVENPSILKMSLSYDINDRTESLPIQFMWDLSSLNPKPGLKQILENIEKAERDDRIKGIYLDLTDVPSGLATVTEIRNALQEFKNSGKFVYAYGNIYTQKAYFLASVADKVFLNPEGFIEMRGFQGQVAFIKGMLDKLGIEAQVMRHGKFKAAVEPLLYDEMSDENREQTLAFVSSMWEDACSKMAADRGMDIAEINRIADMLLAQQPKEAHQLGVVDSLLYMDQFLELLATEIGVEVIKTNNFISLNKYDNVYVKKNDGSRSKNKIAVVFAEGDIMQGNGPENIISSDKLSRTLRNVRMDESIKAMVLRVNSPGGDGLASDIILREMKLAGETMPVVVSMGNYAASGGYYIACSADKIVAQPTTITGSIGVFGVIPNFKKFFNDKLGITFDGVGTNQNSDYISVTQPLSPYQREVIQNEIERFYTTFINHVAVGRNMTPEQVDEIGQGRVWSGKDALERGLVDQLGGLNDAIKLAADLAGLEDYRTIDLPEQKEPIEQLMESLMGETTRTSLLKAELGAYYPLYYYIANLKNSTGIQTRLPFYISVE